MLIFCMFILIILTSILAFAYVRDYFYGKQKLSRLKAGEIIYHENKILKVVEVPVQKERIQ